MATLGKLTVGSSALNSTSNQLRGTQFVAGSGLTSITSGFVYLDGSGGGTGTQKGAIVVYADSGGAPSGAALAISSELTITQGDAAGWKPVTFSSFNLSAGTYWLMWNTGTTSNVSRFYRDNSGTTPYNFLTSTYSSGTAPNYSGGSSGTNGGISIYIVDVGGAPPSNTAAPTISGSSFDGSTLTCANGTWTGTPTSYSYQWTRAGSNISGATSQTYTVQLADRTKAIGCTVIATNGAGSSAPVSSSNTITGTAPSVTNSAKLRYAPPSQTSPITVDLSGTPTSDYFATWTAGADYVITLGNTPRTGMIEVDANGANSVKIIGGVWAFNDGGSKNYHIHIHNLAGWGFVEGQEADMAGTNADFCDISGGSLYTPDVYFQNCRVINLTATDATNHADVFQPQGKVGNIYVDKLTFSSNYQGFTIAADSTGDRAATNVQLHRVNSWFASANPTNPVTSHYWLNEAKGVSGNDTAPFPLTFDRVYIDLVRGNGRSNYSGQLGFAIYPSVVQNGNGLAGGGNYKNTSTLSVFAANEVVGCDANGFFSNPKMLVTGTPISGSPTIGGDVGTDTDGSGSFTPAGIGTSYSTPGYAGTLTTQTIPDITALSPTYTACTGGGDRFTPGKDVFLHIKNGGGSSQTVSVTVTHIRNGDMKFISPSATVPAGGETYFGPFPSARFVSTDGSGLADITYSGVGSMTIAVLQLLNRARG